MSTLPRVSNHRPRPCLLAAATALLIGLTATGTRGEGDHVKLTLVPTGARERLGRAKPQRVELTAEKPANLIKMPEGLVSPLFGVIPAGYGDDAAKTGWIAVLSGQEGDAKLLVDSNRNGDLTDDPACEWSIQTTPSSDGKTSRQYRGGASIDIGANGSPVLVHLGMYRFIPSQPGAADAKVQLFYVRDYMYEGTIACGARTIRAWLTDDLARGDFRGNPNSESSGVSLVLDLNNSGGFDAQDRVVDVRYVFRIDDLNYEITDMAADGSQFRVVRTSKPLRPPAGLEIGQAIPSFTRTTIDGKAIQFPSDYAGKIVFLEFWATNCPTCAENIAETLGAYRAYKDQDFDILGISLDNPGDLKVLRQTCLDEQIPWPQVHEDQVWGSKLVKMLNVTTMPSGFLVDCDNGEILAKDAQLRNGNLDATVKAALDRRRKNAAR